MRLLAALLFLVLGCHAAEPFLKPNDVIALVGGEDMVVANEMGYLEALLQSNLPEYHLKFRSLAWEGDTVFEQRRDLNYPTLEAQLEKMGATVVIAQFGQMESLAGTDHVGEFVAGYNKLLARLCGDGKRKIALVEPHDFEPSLEAPQAHPGAPTALAPGYREGVSAMAKAHPGFLFLPIPSRSHFGLDIPCTRDGAHAGENGQRDAARFMASQLLGLPLPWKQANIAKELKRPIEELQTGIVAKNRLWFQYTRPQNWAFLAGDRTNQPSSRDHIDKNKRWFPEEMEKFVPLIEAKDQEIWALAAKLNTK